MGLLLYFHSLGIHICLLNPHPRLNEDHFPGRFDDCLRVDPALRSAFHEPLADLSVLLIGLLESLHFLIDSCFFLPYEIKHLIQLITKLSHPYSIFLCTAFCFILPIFE